MRNRRERRRRLAIAVILLASVACGRSRDDPQRVPPKAQQAIADSLSALVREAYDLTRGDAAQRLLALYPDSGRVISAAAGRVLTRRDTLAAAITAFWQRVGRNMQAPRFILGSTYVDIITRDAAVMTVTYRIPHRTPTGTSHVVSGAWTMLWRRQRGRWMIVQEHLSDTPESTAPGPTPSASEPP